jgi:hypothetical protein
MSLMIMGVNSSTSTFCLRRNLGTVLILFNEPFSYRGELEPSILSETKSRLLWHWLTNQLHNWREFSPLFCLRRNPGIALTPSNALYDYWVELLPTHSSKTKPRSDWGHPMSFSATDVNCSPPFHLWWNLGSVFGPTNKPFSYRGEL